MKTQILASTVFGLALGFNTPHKPVEHMPVIPVPAAEIPKNIVVLKTARTETIKGIIK